MSSTTRLSGQVGSDPARPGGNGSPTLFATPTGPAEHEEVRDAAPGGSTFAVVRRGYDRGQVDALVARMQKDERGLRALVADTQRKLKLATQHASSTEDENRALRASRPEQAHGPTGGGFGAVAEKFLRLAEAEASQVRAQAAREAVELGERARADAEASRHAAEQVLIARAAELDEATARRNAELRAREDVLGARLDTARIHADQVHAAALRDADRVRQEAEAAVEAVRTRLHAEVSAVRQQAQTEIDRLGAIRNGARAELERITRTIAAEVGSQRYSPRAERAAAGDAITEERARKQVLSR